MSEFRKWLSSFRFAYEGLIFALSTQRNMKFHFMSAFVVLSLALLLHIAKLEILFLILSITLIIMTELINTAIEQAVDLAMPNPHPLAKTAKDVAAAAVLVTAVFAVTVGTIVFFDPLEQLFHQVRRHIQPFPTGEVWIFISLVAFSIIVIHTRLSNRNSFNRPSFLAAIAFSISTMMALLVSVAEAAFLSYLLSFLVLLILYDKTDRSLPSLLLGGLIGSVITLVIYFLSNYWQ